MTPQPIARHSSGRNTRPDKNVYLDHSAFIPTALEIIFRLCEPHFLSGVGISDAETVSTHCYRTTHSGTAMKKSAMVAISLVVLASSSAFAQGKTRAEVYQELIEAQQNGLNYITESSYPDVNPLFAAQVARMKEKHLIQQNAAKAPNTGMAESTAN